MKRLTNCNCPTMSSLKKMAAPTGETFEAKAANFSSNFCVVHVVSSAKSYFSAVHKDNWKRFVNFTSKWLMFDCKEREIVAETATKLGLNFRDVESYITAQPTCANLATTRPLLLFYQRFCDISKMRRKEKKAPAVGGYKTQFHCSEK